MSGASLQRRRLLIVIVAVTCLSRVATAQAAGETAPLLTLDSAIQLAIANNRSLKIASLDVEVSKWQVAAAKTKRLPAFNTYIFGSGQLVPLDFTFKEGSLGLLGGKPNPSRDISISPSQSFTAYAVAQAQQPLSQLYKINLGIREQRLAGDYSSQELRSKRQSVVAQVKQAYYSILQSESALEATEASVKHYQEFDHLMQQYISQEVVLKSESLDVKAKLAQAQYKVVQLHNNLQTGKEQLNDLLGRDLNVDFRTEQVPGISGAESDLSAAQQTALAQRPEIKEAEIGVKKADYDRRIAKADYIPDVGLAVHYISPLNVPIVPQNIASAGVELSWEPFEWGRRKDVINQKKLALEQSQYQLKETQSKVLLDVNNRFRKLDEARVLLGVATAARDAANEKLKEVTDKFGQQAVLLRDVLQQQAAVASANDDYEQALLSFWTAKADFEKSLGED